MTTASTEALHINNDDDSGLPEESKNPFPPPLDEHQDLRNQIQRRRESNTLKRLNLERKRSLAKARGVSRKEGGKSISSSSTSTSTISSDDSNTSIQSKRQLKKAKQIQFQSLVSNLKQKSASTIEEDDDELSYNTFFSTASDELEMQVTELQSKLISKETNVNQLLSQMTNLQSNLIGKEKELQELQQRQDNDDNDDNDKSSDSGKKKKDDSLLWTQLMKLRSEYDEKEREVSQLQLQLNCIQEQQTETNEKNSELKESSKEEASLKKEFQSEIDDLMNSLKQSQSQIQEKEDLNIQLQSQLSSLQKSQQQQQNQVREEDEEVLNTTVTTTNSSIWSSFLDDESTKEEEEEKEFTAVNESKESNSSTRKSDSSSSSFIINKEKNTKSDLKLGNKDHQVKEKDDDWHLGKFGMSGYGLACYANNAKGNNDLKKQSNKQRLRINKAIINMIKKAERKSKNVDKDENLGLLYHSLGFVKMKNKEYDAAMKYFIQCLSIYRNIYGDKNHKETIIADVYSYLGTCYFEGKGEYQNALVNWMKALTIYERTVGSVHPSTSITYGRIASCYKKGNDHESALEYYLNGLSILKLTLGMDHPGTAAMFNNIALCYRDMGRSDNVIVDDNCNNKNDLYNLAIQNFMDCLQIEENVLGTKHPSTALTYYNVGALYYEMKKYKEAKTHMKKAIYIQQKVLGSDHPHTVLSQKWYSKIVADY